MALSTDAVSLSTIIPADACVLTSYTAIQKLRIVTLGISGGRSLTGPLRDARRFPSPRWYPVPSATRTKLGIDICPSFKGLFFCRAVPSPNVFFSQGCTSLASPITPRACSSADFARRAPDCASCVAVSSAAWQTTTPVEPVMHALAAGGVVYPILATPRARGVQKRSVEPSACSESWWDDVTCSRSNSASNATSCAAASCVCCVVVWRIACSPPQRPCQRMSSRDTNTTVHT
jgi:hypothetical protein